MGGGCSLFLKGHLTILGSSWRRSNSRRRRSLMGFVCWVLIVSLLVCWHSLLVVLKTRSVGHPFSNITNRLSFAEAMFISLPHRQQIFFVHPSIHPPYALPHPCSLLFYYVSLIYLFVSFGCVFYC